MNEPDDQERERSFKTYLALAGACLLLMGLVWSLDAFFVYVTLGASVCFFFLAFRNRKIVSQPRRDQWKRPASRTEPTQNSGPPTSSAFDALMDELKRNQKIGSPAPNTTNQNKAVVAAASIFIFFVFTIIFVSVIFLDSESVDYDANTYFQTGEQFLWAHEYDSAKIYYRRALSIQPDYAEALNGYGNALMGLNEYDSALIMMNKGLEANPDYDYGKYSKALVYFYKQNYRQSREELFDLLENTPDYYDAMVLAGDDYYVEQKNDSAFYWYQKAYDNGVRSGGLSRVLAEIHDSKSNREQAIDLYKESLSYDSTNVGIYNRLSELIPGQNGDVYRKAGKRWKDAGY
jgi:tetratricopeptide (TPR) repeat protein